jgi:hypothetical protein
MPGIIGKKLRSRKVKEAVERRQVQVENSNHANRQSGLLTQEIAAGLKVNLNNNYNNRSNLNDKQISNIRQNFNYVSQLSPINSGIMSTSSAIGDSSSAQNAVSSRHFNKSGDNLSSTDNDSHPAGVYDTVTSVHDIEQDDHIYYGEKAKDTSREPLITSFEKKLGKILEVPSKNITRNNSVNDVSDVANTKV